MRRPTPMGVVVVLLCGWFVALVVLIHRSPPAGAASPDALAASFGAAVRADDQRAAARLVLDAPPGDAVATLLRDARCAGPLTGVTAGPRSLLLRDVGGAVCGSLPVAEHGGRWVIDPWAAPVRPAP